MEEVEGLPYKTVKATATQRKKTTGVHGSLIRATDIRKLVKERRIEERKKEEKRKERVDLKVQFLTCKEKCQYDTVE